LIVIHWYPEEPKNGVGVGVGVCVGVGVGVGVAVAVGVGVAVAVGVGVAVAVGVGVGVGEFLPTKGIFSGILYHRLFHSLVDKEEFFLSPNLLLKLLCP
jgi:hypothetical protein